MFTEFKGKSGIKGRPRGSKNKVRVDSLNKAMAYPEALQDRKPKKEKEKVVGVLKETKRRKYADVLDRVKLEKEFRERFLAGKFKIKQSIIISGSNWDIREGDIKYQVV